MGSSAGRRALARRPCGASIRPFGAASAAYVGRRADGKTLYVCAAASCAENLPSRPLPFAGAAAMV